MRSREHGDCRERISRFDALRLKAPASAVPLHGQRLLRSWTRKWCNLLYNHDDSYKTASMAGILDILAVTGMIAVSLAVTVPLTGALVRLRANFNPRSIQLDAEGNVEPHTGPIVTSFFGMLARVKRIEVRAIQPAY